MYPGRSCGVSIAVIIGLLLALPIESHRIAQARTWRVPSESPTIYGAIDSAAYGDTVLVAPGTYCREREKAGPYGMDVWIEMKDGIKLISEGGPEVTTLVETAPAIANLTILCDSILDAEVNGFTITWSDCSPPRLLGYYNYAVIVVSSDMLVENNVILHFRTGIDIRNESPHDGTPVIRGNVVRFADWGISVSGVFRLDTPVIEGNTVRDCHYGIWNRDSNAYIVGNTIVGNTETGIHFEAYSQSLMHSNKIIGNGKYGVYDCTYYVYQSPCLNCTLTKETANDVYGNGLYDVYFVEETGLGLFGACYNYWGTLCPDSSRFYGRVDISVWVDSTHTVVCTDCDSCYHSTQPTTWGSIKGMFR
jgi:hypothetical protein